ncbi:stealth conserved region 3 domain-containing protein [Arthrobacter mobilis]|uniref:Sugar phosphotransferase n=1 Tax=Arthrobacter mobilis TaxID=2724944 RepID=A0A7X6HBL2_9MICC|nr:stealth conserved region 3 domain-containing protein [Arthrobacter mobilis]NKX53148.1 sugar phosphotransferase [Arthrobacter mobilis]
MPPADLCQEEPISNPVVPQDVYYGAPEPADGTDVVEVTSAAAVARFNGRDDVVQFKGRYALVNRTLTPHEAMVEDLLFIRGVLDDAGLPYLLVRGNDARPVIAVDWDRRAELVAALVAACRNEPFYSMTVDAKKKTALLVADGELAESSKPRMFRLYRPRLEPDGGLLYRAGAGVQLELWKWDGGLIHLPIENSLTRRTVLAGEATRGTVRRYGLEWPTIENMFADHATDIDFEIDIVFSWVDGNNPEYQQYRAGFMENVIVGEGDDADARFRQINELKYALRSVHMFAPWIRRIFIATDSPVPQWLDASHPKITVVRSEEHFRDPSVLPVFNSQAVESQLQHIEGLSEYFLYSNDDMFFGRPVAPDMFFSPGGITKFIEASTRIGLGDNHLDRSGFENAARVNRRLLWERFGRITTRHLEHCAAPLRKSVLCEMEQEFAEEFKTTAASRFRAKDNISVTNSLYHYYSLLTGRAVTKIGAKVTYVDTTMHSGLKKLKRLLKKRNRDFFCLNDGSFPEVSAQERQQAVTTFLDKYFPIPAPWEKPEDG